MTPRRRPPMPRRIKRECYRRGLTARDVMVVYRWDGGRDYVVLLP